MANRVLEQRTLRPPIGACMSERLRPKYGQRPPETIMTTLYYAVSACSLAPHIVLAWIGAPYEAVKVHYGSQDSSP